MTGERIWRAATWSWFQCGDTQVIDTPAWAQLRTPSMPGGWRNEVAVSVVEDLDLDAIDARFPETIYKWSVTEWTRPEDTGRRLAARGFESWAFRGMAAETPDFSVPEDVEVRISSDAGAIAALLAKGWGGPRERIEPEIHWALAQGRFHYAVATVQGDTAGVGGVVIGDFAYLTGGVVLPAFRGRGVYRALVRARLDLAGGLPVGTQAREATSAPILERLGFATVFHGRIFQKT